jgi:hypothetical protein
VDLEQGAQRLAESRAEVQTIRDHNDQVFCLIHFGHEGTDVVMPVWVMRLLCLQLERDIQNLRERNAEVCHI